MSSLQGGEKGNSGIQSVLSSGISWIKAYLLFSFKGLCTPHQHPWVGSYFGIWTHSIEMCSDFYRKCISSLFHPCLISLDPGVYTFTLWFIIEQLWVCPLRPVGITMRVRKMFLVAIILSCYYVWVWELWGAKPNFFVFIWSHLNGFEFRISISCHCTQRM